MVTIYVLFLADLAYRPTKLCNHKLASSSSALMLALVSSYVYSASCQMVDACDFICGTYVHMHLPYYAHQIYEISAVWWVYLFLAHIAITCEVIVAAVFVPAHIFTNVGSICLCRMRAV